MRLRLSSLAERARASLFFVPLASVIVAVVLGVVMLEVDRQYRMDANGMPLGLTSTVASARTALSTIAGATISFAGVAFSVSLLVIQLTASQYSPRITHTVFRDPFNRRIVGVVVGTFTYCIVVLRSVRSALSDGGEPVIPTVSVALAVGLGIITILAVVAFIDHSAHSMDVSAILGRVRREATDHVRQEWDIADGSTPPAPPMVLSDGSTTVRFARTGWVQQIDRGAIAAAVPPASMVRLETRAGRYGITHGPICTISPPPADPAAVEQAIRAAVALGETRTMQQDASYGLRQLVDVAVKALSPGINDPTTAQDAIFHAVALLSEMLRRNPPSADVLIDGRRVLSAQSTTPNELVALAFEETRRVAADHPAVCVYLLAAMSALVDSLSAAGLAHRTDAIRDQAALVVAGCRAAGHLADDEAQVQTFYDSNFS